VSDLGRSRSNRLPRIGKRAAAATPPEFRDVLLAMARCRRNAIDKALTNPLLDDELSAP
jgi:hypothetical protein